MEYHDNVVKLEFNKGKLCEDNLGCFGYFEVKDFCITEGQDPDGKIKVGNKYSINNEGEIVFSVGRKGSEKVAKWWKENIYANQTTFNHDPEDLNFAFIGDLVLNASTSNDVVKKTITFKNIGLAQGHSGASNNWWFGGEKMHYIGNNKVAGEDENSIIGLCAHRGGNGVNEVEVYLQTLIPWISKVPNETLLCEMSIPGTHDSGTSSLFGVTDKGAAHCQNFNIIQQLNDGIRFLDIRIGLDLRLNHGGTLSNYTWDDAMSQIITFLNINPDEFVIMLIGSEVVSNSWSDEMKSAVSEYNYMYIDTFDPLKISVKDVRGKILLLKRQEACPYGKLLKFSDNTTFDYDGFKVEDYYKEHDTTKKFEEVKKNLELARESEKGKCFFVTFNSIAFKFIGCRTPYYYAWNCGNDAMNERLTEYLSSCPGKNTWGAILLDFYNDKGDRVELVKNIINSNFKENLY